MNKNISASVYALSLVCLVSGCQEKPKEPEVSNLAPVPMKEETAAGIAVNVAQPLTQQQFSPTQVSPADVAPEGAEVVEDLQEASKPAEQQIQQALKNAGLYEGEIDGKIGPKTKKAIEAFQVKNNLKVDGKVGPQTWGRLKEYLDAASPAAAEGIKN